MLSAIVFAAAAIWLLVMMLVLGLCRDAKAGDQAMEIARERLPLGDSEGFVIEPSVSAREQDTRRLARLA